MKAIHKSPIHYRPEIDGLRAVAVLPVILFHAGLEPFSGGYVGVDVFFVISGYLITSILLSELGGGNYSIIKFYERRARRILPALFFVLLCCIPIAWFLLLPDELKKFGQSLFAVALFSSNVYFWKTTDYFAPAAEELPLLHTWSLSVEEQYYVIFPVLLLLLWRFGRRRAFISISLLLLLSLAFSQYAWKAFPVANFFLLPSRAWEILIGSCLAFLVPSSAHNPVKNDRQWRSLLATAGLGMIFAAVFLFDGESAVPGLAGLVPTLGAALVIACGDARGLANRVLCSSPMITIGLISYSAYLWHQPLLAFVRVSTSEVIHPGVGIAIACLSLALAHATWRYVETPFRDRKRLPPGFVLSLSAVLLVSTAAVGLFIHLSDGQLGRFDTEVIQFAEQNRSNQMTCQKRHKHDPCLMGEKDASPSVALWGDSHAGALAPAIDEALLSSGRSGWLFSLGGCPPLSNIKRLDQNAISGCSEFNRAALQKLVSDATIRDVIIYTRWVIYVEGDRFDNGQGGREPGPRVVLVGDKDVRPIDIERRKQLIAGRLRATLLSLINAGKRVTLIYPAPEFGWNVSSLVLRPARLVLHGGLDPEPLVLRRSLVESRRQQTLEALDAATDDLPVLRIDPIELFCDSENCRSGSRGAVWFSDDDHLSADGARYFLGRTRLTELLGTEHQP